MRSTFLRIRMRTMLVVILIITSLLLITACKEVEDLYTPSEWLEMFKKAGGWTPLPFPDSKFHPGSIIKVTEADGIRWIDDFSSCRYPVELFLEKSYIPGMTFTKEKTFGANAMINFKGISAGPAFDSIAKVSLAVQDHGADALQLIKLKVWLEKPQNRKTVSSACMDELKKSNHYLVTEAFRVSKGTYTLYDKNGAAIKLTAPKLGNLLQFEPNVKYEITNEGKLVVDQPVYFAIRKAASMGGDFEVLGEENKAPQTADVMIEKLFMQSEKKQ